MSTASVSLKGCRRRGRLGDLLLLGVTFAASAGAVALLVGIALEVLGSAHLAYSKFGLGFVTSRVWDPVKGHFGALDLIWGTAITSFLALLIATPLSIAIGLYLSELAPRGVRDVVGALVEMLAAVPSVIVGLWGILVLGPFVQHTLEPFLHGTLGFLPLFGGKTSIVGILPATIVLTIMVVPIVASISRELFLTVPAELKEGALALGMTRWEMVRGVVLPYARPGIVAAVILGLGRAVGEAIAVTQVIGNTLGIHVSLFATGDTLASRIASQYQGASSKLQLSAIVYLAAILLVITLAANVFAQLIVRRFEFQKTGGH
ncbi:MAG: phosphate ABC transporter permease subunit PstC [Actinomycetota bacterium]